MSDMRKLLKIMESVPAFFPDQPSPERLIKQDATVMISPEIGGGTGRYVHSTPNGAMIDIKGVVREFANEEFSLPERDYEDPYQKGNDWFHVTQEPVTPGTSNDKPEFRAGDMVKIADVYGTVIGPGIGVFVAYGTTGEDCIVSFDNKEMIIPVANIGAALEQDAKDNFDQMDNDGNLSPMTFGSDNVKIEQPQTGMSRNTEMGQRDEISRWMAAVEEAMEVTSPIMTASPQMNNCGCGNWQCPTCFPDEMNAAPVDAVVMDPMGMGEPEVCPACGQPHDTECDAGSGELEVIDGFAEDDGSDMDMDVPVDETENDFIEKGSSGKGVKLGDIVQKTEYRKTGGENSPMTYGDDNLGEDELDNFDDLPSEEQMAQDQQAAMDFGNPSDGDIEDSFELMSQIVYMQDMGLSKADQHWAEEDMANMDPASIKKAHSMVMGNVAEAKPTATKTQFDFDLDDMDDILSPKPANPVANVDAPAGDSPMGPSGTGDLPRAGAANTQAKVGAMTGTDQMRDWMGKISPDAGMGEPELPQTAGNEVSVRSAADVPATVSNAMQASGTVSPQWHSIRDLPGFGNRNIRGMGRNVFSMFTSTPLEELLTIANVNGQGPNTDGELRSVANWLKNYGEDMGPVTLDHGQAIPGYRPDVREFRANGVRFHVVRDPMGQYIYAYPEKDARTHAPAALPGAPQLGMNESVNWVKPTLFEKIKWDEELDEAFIEESSLSKLIGKQQGGQNLVRWLHKKHKLGNEAELVPAPFNERIFWKQFKSNPDDFVIVSAQNGVAGIKPSEEYIKHMQEKFAKKGKTYNPSGDANLQYQAVAFTDDGKQIDPKLLQAQPKDGEEDKSKDDKFISRDPTVIKARMGLHSGKDIQNPDNIFNLLADQIGALRMVYTSGFENSKDAGAGAGSVERDKMKQRADMKTPTSYSETDAVKMIFQRVRPVLKTLANQALSQITRTAQRYMNGGNFEAGQKVMQSGQRLKQLLVQMDTPGDININTGYGSVTKEISNAIIGSLERASGSRKGTPEFTEWLNDAAKGNAAALRPVLDGLRDVLVNIPG